MQPRQLIDIPHFKTQAIEEQTTMLAELRNTDRTDLNGLMPLYPLSRLMRTKLLIFYVMINTGAASITLLHMLGVPTDQWFNILTQLFKWIFASGVAF
jgi:hypothetical protein